MIRRDSKQCAKRNQSTNLYSDSFRGHGEPIGVARVFPQDPNLDFDSSANESAPIVSRTERIYDTVCLAGAADGSSVHRTDVDCASIVVKNAARDALDALERRRAFSMPAKESESKFSL